MERVSIDNLAGIRYAFSQISCQMNALAWLEVEGVCAPQPC